MTRRTELLWLAAITLIAAAVRFPALGTNPPGLLLDEGRMGLLAQATLRGEDPRLWLHSVEIFAWLPTVGLFSFLPDTVATLRLVPAIWGTLTIPALWWAVRPLAGSEIALGAAGVLATMRWHVALTRIAVSGYLMPLAATLAAGCIIRAMAAPGSGWWLLSGLATGLGMHTYPGARVLPLIIGAGLAGWWTGRQSDDRRASLLRWAGGFAVGFAIAGWYIPWHPERFLLRIGEVTGEVATPAQAFRNFLRGLGALNIGGSDLTHTFPAPGGSPLLGPVANLLWIPGVIAIFMAGSLPIRWMLSLWLAAGFAGGLFSGPHGMRQFLLAPVAAAGVAVAGSLVLRRAGPRVAMPLLLVLAAAQAGGELWRYGLGPHGGIEPRTVEWVYRGQEVAMAARLREEAAHRPVFWSPDAVRPEGTPIEWYAAPTIFLSTPPLRRDPPGTAAELARSGGVIVFPMVSLMHLALLREAWPGGYIWEGRSIDPRKLIVYAAGPSSLRKAKVPLYRAPEVFRAGWEAEAVLKAGSAAAAADRFAVLAAAWPKIGALRADRATALMAAGRFTDAEAAARGAIRTGAAGGFAELYLGASLLEQRRFGEAAGVLATAARLAPDNEEAWLGRVAALANGGRIAEARSVLSEALRRFPNSPRAAGLAAQLGL